MSRIDDVSLAMDAIEHAIVHARGVTEAVAQKAAVAQMERDQALASYNNVVTERDQAIAEMGQWNAIADRIIAAAHDVQALYPE